MFSHPIKYGRQVAGLARMQEILAWLQAVARGEK
jgi:hypothetical protein